ncbi:helix-turn-helix domain-containing protein [Phenylobacterium sp.]|uniref:AraC family transcriptional regulator n=1 Tax=Phenylobacterium sp. TaxID=1871053 RepID=UPI0035660D22
MREADVSFRYFLPAPALRATITTYYVLEVGGDGLAEELLFPEWANIRLLLDGEWTQTFGDGRVVTHSSPTALMSGVISRTARVRCPPGRMVGAGFLPAGWAVFTALPACDYVNDIIPLSNFIGAAADELLGEVLTTTDDAAMVAALDAWFLARMAGRKAAEALLVAAHEAMLDPEVRSVAEWARRLGRSPRQLERLALTYFGMGPKALLRRQRFLRSFAAIREHPPGLWGRMIDPGYVDQSQFIRDFRYFMGMAPRAYFARDFSFMRAAGRARAALLGDPLHGLHAAVPAADPKTA